MKNRFLGSLALAGAPWLAIGTFIQQFFPQLVESWFTGVWGLLYMIGWICSLIGLQRLMSAAKNKLINGLFVALYISLTVANYSNILNIIFGKNKPGHFFYVDLFWPFSNLLMLILGITIALVGGLQGWKRYVPLFVGGWLPFSLMFLWIYGRTNFTFTFSAVYSLIAWTLLAIIVRNSNNKTTATAMAVKRDLVPIFEKR